MSWLPPDKSLHLPHFRFLLSHQDPLWRRRVPGLYSLPCPLLSDRMSHIFSLQLVSVFVLTLKSEKPHLFPSPRTPTGSLPLNTFLPCLHSPLTKLLLCARPCARSWQYNTQRRRSLSFGSLLVWHTQVTFSNQGRVRTALIPKGSIMLLWHLHLARVCPAETVKSNLLPLFSYVTLSKLINHSELQFPPHKTRLIIVLTFRVILQVKSFKH